VAHPKRPALLLMMAATSSNKNPKPDRLVGIAEARSGLTHIPEVELFRKVKLLG
jgi:hypothetical protein